MNTKNIPNKIPINTAKIPENTAVFCEYRFPSNLSVKVYFHTDTAVLLIPRYFCLSVLLASTGIITTSAATVTPVIVVQVITYSADYRKASTVLPTDDQAITKFTF
jgi:hypothetical protein